MNSNAGQVRRSRGGYVLPLIVVAVMSAFFLAALRSGDPSRLPSALIGKPVPEFTLGPIEGQDAAGGGDARPGISSAGLVSGEVTIVNMWASWCGPCVQEHPQLVALKQQYGLRLVGINYKDEPAAARRFLARYGNPFDAIGADTTGRVAIDWGVYGVPETYVVDGRGRIAFKFVGPLSAAAIKDQILPAIAKAKSAPLRDAQS
jgi:cytochrome c biogenesis protein CcmG/thiol:disulfide interchange protein DsbE